MTEVLPVQLTEQELLEKGDRLAAITQEITVLELEKKVQASSFKVRIDAKVEEQRTIADTIKSGYENRPVEVVEQVDVAARIVRVVRVDTGEIVRTRNLNIGDTQVTMFEENPEEWDNRHEGKIARMGI